MAKSKFNTMWYLLSNHSVETVEPVSIDLQCTICKKLCVEPYSALCGCQFCLRCIRDFLVDDKQFCPGDKEECHSEYLKLNSNVMTDLKMMHSLSKVMIKCPNKFCDFKSKLECMENHLKKCRHNNSSLMGFDLLSKEIKSQLKLPHGSEILTNGGAIIKMINTMRDNFAELQQMLVIKEKEIVRLKEDSSKTEIVISDMRENLKWLTDRVENLELINLLKETEMNEIKEDFNKREDHIKEVLKQNTTSVHHTPVFSFDDESVTELTYRNSFRDKITSDIEEVNQNESNINAMLNELRFNSSKEFYWTIDNFRDNQTESRKLRSAPFYRCSYKMHLFVGFVDNKLRLLCHILKGEFDAYIEWPMKKRITLSILNQDTNKIYRSNIFNFDSYKNKNVFNKPQNARNEGFGSNSFIHFDDLTNIKGLLCNNCLIISCLIDD